MICWPDQTGRLKLPTEGGGELFRNRPGRKDRTFNPVVSDLVLAY